MGYKNPIVCKEVYLPIPTGLLTFEEYKKKYGIDIEELIYIDGGLYYLKPFTKYFIVDSENVLNDTGSAVERFGVYEAHLESNDNYSQDEALALTHPFIIDLEGTLSIKSEGLIITGVSKTIGAFVR